MIIGPPLCRNVSGRWPGDSQREPRRFARIDSQKKTCFHNVRAIRTNRPKPAIRNFWRPGALKRFARIRRFARICPSKVGDFCCMNVGGFCQGFPGGFFWAFSIPKCGEKIWWQNPREKSGTPKIKSAKNPFCQKLTLMFVFPSIISGNATSTKPHLSSGTFGNLSWRDSPRKMMNLRVNRPKILLRSKFHFARFTLSCPPNTSVFLPRTVTPLHSPVLARSSPGPRPFLARPSPGPRPALARPSPGPRPPSFQAI